MNNLNSLINEETYITGNTVPVIKFKAFEDIDFINHCFTTRLGGNSNNEFTSLNLSFSRGDDTKNVEQNYIDLCKDAGFTLKNIVMSDQVHETTVLNITNDVLSSMNKSDFKLRKLESVDGMITNITNVPLFTYYADCVPLYFVDPVKKAIGLSHSGWRGTAHCMGLKTINAMKEAFGTNPKDLISVIGPSICQKCYEVSADVIEIMNNEFITNGIISDTDTSFYYEKENGKFQVDLWRANYLIIKKAGVLPHNIHVSGICTYDKSDLLFSHRASGTKRGNLAAILEIIK